VELRERVELSSQPFLENDKIVATICSDPDLDLAADGAIRNMSEFLMKFASLSLNDAGMSWNVSSSKP
jgi:acetamidase/formamidase